MSHTLRPQPGFNWMLVSWGAPDQFRTEHCSYCCELLDEEAVPLILWNTEGWCAEFCHACQCRWWGFTPMDRCDVEDDDDQEHKSHGE